MTSNDDVTGPVDDVEVEPIDLDAEAGDTDSDDTDSDDTDPDPAADDAAAAPVDETGDGGQSDSGADGDPADLVDEGDLADEISSEIDQLAAERDQYKDIAQRLQADFENYRKRVAAQQAAEIERATGAFAEALLPVLDAAEAAYVGHPDEVGPLLNLLLAELKKRGLEAVDLLGKPFDPNLADAVAHEPGDGGEPVVAEVLRSGYTWNGRTLRPAMVRTKD
ncbi:nucleotide exchange factor GrpE [Desertimonas flava]|uniref:nucleotide exchange factor GrpE n=1 Tax=Desertimonas flava TaxID=2064846 RepID=UPI000E348BDF|nr:nucleotide exchange factor GrpE [Desertimonas flava]